MSSRFVFLKILSTVTHMKKLALFSALHAILLMIEILACFWYFSIAFSTGSEMLEIMLRYCWSISIPRFGTISAKKVLKVFAIFYLFLVNRSFSLSVI